LFIRAEAWQVVGATIANCRGTTRMNARKNARTTPFGRAVMVRRVLEEGWSVAAVASAFGVSTRIVRKWLARIVGKWLARFGSEGVAGLQNRSSAPHLVANKLAAPWVDMIVRLRREYRMTGEEIAARLRLPRSTVASHLRRLGLGRLAALEPSEPARRYSRARAGELVHLDVKKLARFRRIGHRITGDRRGQSEGAGWEFVHVAVDDASRPAYVELLPDEKRQSVTGFLIRALRWFRRLGILVERVMTDNGSGYVSRLFKKACRLLRLRHLRTRPYTPKTNGKAERFIQTLMREWAYALPYRSSDTRAADLPRWLRHYNNERPHASLARQSPTAWLQAHA
jgi:transposase InsO family protein